MICVGIDVSKRKSTVCFMAPGDKIIRRPFDVKHTKEERSEEHTSELQSL